MTPVFAAVVSPQFEVCYALAEAVRPRAKPVWLSCDARQASWYEEASMCGRAFWLALPYVLANRPPVATFDELVAALSAVPGEVAQRRLIRGLFHGEEEPSPRKREWLAHIGVDERGIGSTKAGLRRAGETLRTIAVAVLERFWVDFAPIWQERLYALRHLERRASVLARSGRLAATAAELKLKVEVEQGYLRALRGGYKIAVGDIERVYLIPSFVNTQGFWSAADETLPANVYFPFVDPDRRADPELQAAIDPWLVSRALADPTRAAIVRRLNAETMTSAQIMRELGLSRANVSHHMFQLREAGLLLEQPIGRAVALSLNWATLDKLSEAFRLILEPPSPGPRRSARNTASSSDRPAPSE